MDRRVVRATVLVGLLLAAAVVLRLVVGAGGVAWPDTELAWELRLHRVLVGGAVGVCLAVSGVLLQSLLRNPLASPDLLGVSSAASLAVMIAAWVGGAGAASSFGLWQAGPAVIGAGACLAVVWRLGSGRRGEGIDPRSLILVGVMIGVMCGAGTMLVQHLIPGGAGVGLARMLVGSLSDDTPRENLAAGWLVAAGGLVGAMMMGRSMDALTMGDDEALSVGVAVRRVRAGLLVMAGVTAAAAVVLAGPVGFVGLVGPHFARLMTGMRGGHRALAALSAGVGAALVIGADAAVKVVDVGTGRLPLGVVTALVGGAVFVGMMRRGGR